MCSLSDNSRWMLLKYMILILYITCFNDHMRLMFWSYLFLTKWACEHKLQYYLNLRQCKLHASKCLPMLVSVLCRKSWLFPEVSFRWIIRREKWKERGAVGEKNKTMRVLGQNKAKWEHKRLSVGGWWIYFITAVRTGLSVTSVKRSWLNGMH